MQQDSTSHRRVLPPQEAASRHIARATVQGPGRMRTPRHNSDDPAARWAWGGRAHRTRRPSGPADSRPAACAQRSDMNSDSLLPCSILEGGHEAPTSNFHSKVDNSGTTLPHDHGSIPQRPRLGRHRTRRTRRTPLRWRLAAVPRHLRHRLGSMLGSLGCPLSVFPGTATPLYTRL